MPADRRRPRRCISTRRPAPMAGGRSIFGGSREQFLNGGQIDGSMRSARSGRLNMRLAPSPWWRSPASYGGRGSAARARVAGTRPDACCRQCAPIGHLVLTLVSRGPTNRGRIQHVMRLALEAVTLPLAARRTRGHFPAAERRPRGGVCRRVRDSAALGGVGATAERAVGARGRRIGATVGDGTGFAGVRARPGRVQHAPRNWRSNNARAFVGSLLLLVRLRVSRRCRFA